MIIFNPRYRYVSGAIAWWIQLWQHPKSCNTNMHSAGTDDMPEVASQPDRSQRSMTGGLFVENPKQI